MKNKKDKKPIKKKLARVPSKAELKKKAAKKASREKKALKKKLRLKKAKVLKAQNKKLKAQALRKLGIKRKYNRPYQKPTKKSKYSQFRKSLSEYLRENDIKLQGLDGRLAIQNFSELSKKIWQENKEYSLKVIAAGYDKIVGDWLNLKRKDRPEKPIIPEFSQHPSYYWNIDTEFSSWRDFLPRGQQDSYLYAWSCSILPKGILIKIDGNPVGLDDYYKKNLKEWVDFANYFHKQRAVDGSDAVEIFYKFSDEIIWDEKRHCWLIEFFSCDKFGMPDDFGFIPSEGEPCEELPKSVFGKEKEVSGEAPKPKEFTAQEIIDIEKAKQQTAIEERKTIEKKIELVDKVLKMKEYGFTNEQINRILGL